MGLLSSSVAFSRFRINGEVSSGLLSQIPAALIRNSFRDIDRTTDERSFGWVCFDNFLDSEWAGAPPEKGEFMVFALRLDTRRVAPAVLRKHFRMALEKEMSEQNKESRKFISKGRKKEIKEQVSAALLATTLPVPAVFDVAWNLRDNIVYFASVREKIIELFMQNFKQTFDLYLERITPYASARYLIASDRITALEAMESADFGE